MPKTIFELSSEGRKGFTLPKNDVDLKLDNCISENFRRKENLNLPEVSELDVLRHFTTISEQNHCIEKGFYPLGSCTMKYNPKINDKLVANPKFTEIHPLQNDEDVQGTLEILFDLGNDLAEISGFEKVSLQPVAGASGEFAGLKVMSAYHKANGNENKKNIILPDSAHGTNPASAILAGFNTIEIKSNEKGMVDLDVLREVVDENTAGLMLTNPNTLGLFEEEIEEIAKIIHDVDGLMYMDGANFNALLGCVRPGDMGFDVMHYNLHKTFATPHGGGGPGAGPIGVVEKLKKFLPYPLISEKNGKFVRDFSHKETSIGKVHGFYGNIGVDIRAFNYLKMLGAKGLKRVTKNAIINANYLRKKLTGIYDIPYNDTCMHEFVASGSKHKKEYGISTLDIAKGLLEKGIHAPTIYFPLIVNEAMMIEPTETESKETLDNFVEVMKNISEQAKNDPKSLHDYPTSTPVRRLDETRANRKVNVTYEL